MPVPRRFDRRPPDRDTTRVNERIRVPEVRVIDDQGEQVGVMRTEDALRVARSRELDLVEVAAAARPPVCRILDYSKYKYEQSQKQKAARKHQTQVTVREIKFRPKIAGGDYNTKKGHVERFLKARDKVKVTIMFRGREVTHPERGRELLERLVEDLGDLAQVDQRPNLEGRNMTMLVSPSKALINGTWRPPEEREDAEGESTGGPADAPTGDPRVDDVPRGGAVVDGTRNDAAPAAGGSDRGEEPGVVLEPRPDRRPSPEAQASDEQSSGEQAPDEQAPADPATGEPALDEQAAAERTTGEQADGEEPDVVLEPQSAGAD